MFKVVGYILIGVGIALLLGYIRGKFLNKVKDKIDEKWDTSKFVDGLTQLKSRVKWGKSFNSDFNFRTMIIRLSFLCLIASVIYGVGVYRGRLGKPVHVDLNYEKSFTLQLNGTILHKPKNSSQLELLDKDGNKIKDIKVGDVEELRKALKPYGIDIKPFMTMGYGFGERHTGKEVGLGTQIFKYYKAHIDAWLSNRGAYVGTDYHLTDNFGVIGGIGKGYSGDSRWYFGGMWRF